MYPFDFHCPTRIVFGPGRFAELGDLAAALGVQRVLVVSDPGIEEVGHTQRGVESLQAAGLKTHVFDKLQENPTTANVDDGVAVAKEYKPDCIVAIGGGSSMDCAKGINFVYSCGGRMQDYWGVGKATSEMLPMIAVPTTSGTGSEAQSFALISDAETHVKMACGDKRAACKIALLDPELTITQPQRVTALTGMDAISHAVETLVTKKRNPLSMALSREAWRLLTGGFERVLDNPKDLEARGLMQQGACFAGLAIENSMLGGAHALANPLTATYGITHGEAVGLMLPQIVQHNAGDETCAHAYGEFLRELGYSNSVERLVSYLSKLAHRAGLAGTLAECGVDRNRLPELAEAASQQWVGTFNPVEMSQDDYLQLYQLAFD